MTAIGETVTIEIPSKGVKLEIKALDYVVPVEPEIAKADLSAGIPAAWFNYSNPNWAKNAVTVPITNGVFTVAVDATRQAVFEVWPLTGLTPGDKLAIEFDYDASANAVPYVGANTAADLSGTWLGGPQAGGAAKTKQRVPFTASNATMWLIFGNNTNGASTVKYSNLRVIRPFEVAAPPANPQDLRVWQGGNLYHPKSYIRTPLRADAPLLSNSAAIVADFTRQWQNNFGHIEVGISSYTPPVFIADATTPTGSVKSDDPHQDWAVPMHINEMLSAVPMPTGFGPSAGTDAEAVVILKKQKPDGTWTFTMYELWGLRKDDTGRFTPNQWICRTGSRTDNVETHAGFYPLEHGTINGLPWDFYPGVTAAGLPFYPLLISAEDLKAGVIDHALGVAIIETAPGFVWPATRTDGGENTPIKEGMCLRFPTSINFDTISSPLARMIGKAIQKYGMYVLDRSGTVGIRGQNPLNLNPDPWWGPGGILGYPGAPADIYAYWPPVHTAQLPWTQLVAVDPRAGTSLYGA